MKDGNKGWVKDVMETFAVSVISELEKKNSHLLNRTGSRYVKGKPRGRESSVSGQPMIGIYLISPTANPK